MPFRYTTTSAGFSKIRGSFLYADMYLFCAFLDVYRIYSGKARCAELVFRNAGCAYHAFVREKAKRGGTEVFTHFFHRLCCGNQSPLFWRINAVKIRVLDRRRGNEKMHFLGPCLKQHLYYLPRSRPAHDGVVENDDALPTDNFGKRGEVRPYALFSDMLFGRNERAMDVSVLGETPVKRDAECTCVTDSGSDCCFRHGYNHVGFQRILFRKFLAEILADLVHRFTEKNAVRARKVDELENIELRIRFRYLHAFNAVLADDDHFARLHVAHVLSADWCERACFRRNNISPVQFRERERTYAAFIADSNEFVFGHNDKRKCPGKKRIDGFDGGSEFDAFAHARGDSFLNHPRIGKFGCVDPARFQEIFELFPCRKIPIVCEGYGAVIGT